MSCRREGARGPRSAGLRSAGAVVPLKNRRGFSLVEVIIAATVLALALAFAVSVLPSTALSVRRAEKRVTAAGLAQSLLEYQRARTDLTLMDALYDTVAIDQWQFRRQLKVSEITGSTGAALPETRLVRVTVSWEESGKEYRVFRETVVNRGL